MISSFFFFFFFFNDTATTEIYTLSLHDALRPPHFAALERPARPLAHESASPLRDRKSTRLNSSHGYISYAVFCLKKKTKQTSRLQAPRKERKSPPSSPI